MDLQDRSRRALAVAVFCVIVLLDLAYVLLSRGLHHQSPLSDDSSLDTAEAVGILLQAVVGLALTWARPRNAVGWVISLPPLLLGLCDAGQAYGARAAVFPDEWLPGARLALAMAAPLWIPSLFIPVTVLLVRYPTGRIQTRWGRRFDRAVIVGVSVLCVGYALSREAVSDVIEGGQAIVDLGAVPWVVPAGSAIAGVASLVGLVGILGEAVWRVVKGPRAERMALLWLLSVAVLAVLAVWFGSQEWLGTVFFNGILVAVAIGVVRYGAVGIELALRRTLVYGGLTGLVLAVFLAVVTGLAALLPSGPAPNLVAAAVVAICLAPARERIQSFVDRLLYGERRDPYAALRHLGEPVESAGTLLPGVLAALARSMRVDEVSVEVGSEPEGAVPLAFGGEDLGHLVARPRRGERTLGQADRRLLEAVAPMIAAVVHADRLTADLARERERVVAATSAERRRLRRELHDGLGPSLTGVALGLEAAERRHDPALLARLRSEAAAALEEVRRIIDDLRPSALDDADLLTALRRRTDQLGATGVLRVDLDLPDTAPPVPEAVAAAAYRIADEALTNVVRHSGAQSCRVIVRVDGDLCLTVSDDGVGPAGACNGEVRDGAVGLTSMRERAERLGGLFEVVPAHPGTQVSARLPLEVTT